MTVVSKQTPENPGRRNFLAGTAIGGVAVAMSSQAALGDTANQPILVSAEALGIATDDIDVGGLPRVRQELVAPPHVPAHDQVATGGPKIVEVHMDIEEKLIEIDSDGASIWAFAFNGSVPGPMIVVHQGDYVELTLRNLATNELEHNIDFHASTGALGGGGLTHVLPGEEVVLRWRALKAGTFVYHCAPGGDMIPYHVCHGMSGAVMVLPRDGLKDAQGNPYTYDRAYYIGENDFYLPRDENGDWRKYEFSTEDYSDSLDVMRTLVPTHVVFNGARGALAGDNAMTAKVGEKVLFIHAQANRDSRPHLIGGHGDLVWETGSFSDVPLQNAETWFVRGGSAAAMAYQFVMPGTYAYVTHNLIEAVLLGALAHVKVEGEWDNRVMEQVKAPYSY